MDCSVCRNRIDCCIQYATNGFRHCGHPAKRLREIHSAKNMKAKKGSTMTMRELALPHFSNSLWKRDPMSEMNRTKVRVLVAIGALIASVGLTAAACVGRSVGGFDAPNAQSTVSQLNH